MNLSHYVLFENSQYRAYENLLSLSHNYKIGLALGGSGTDYILKLAIPFTPTTSYDLIAMDVWLSVLNAPPGSLSIEVWSDSGGKPDASLGTAYPTFLYTNLAGSATRYHVDFTNIALSSATDYWLVYELSANGDNTNYWKVSYDYADSAPCTIAYWYDDGGGAAWHLTSGTVPNVIFYSAEEAFYHADADTYRGIGTTVWRRAQAFTTPASSLPVGSILFMLNSITTPDVNIACAIYSDNSGPDTLIYTSINNYVEDKCASGYTRLIFYFTGALLDPSTTYHAVLFVDGISTGSYRILTDSNDVYSQQYYYNGSWYTQAGHAFWMLIDYGLDITDDTIQISTNIGKAKVNEGYQEGTCTIVVHNKDGDYYVENSSSLLYKIWTTGDARIQIAMSRGSNMPVCLFSGRIKSVVPDFSYETQTATIELADISYFLKNTQVSPGTLNGKKAHELFEAIVNNIDNVGRTPWDAETDDAEVLANVTWNNTAPMDLLETIAEVGQHHIFVDQNGVLQFKNNQWLDSHVADHTLDNEDLLASSVTYDMDAVKNKVRVKYPTDTWTECENENSIMKYSERVLEIDNELMSDQTYAEAIANYILEFWNTLNGDLILTLEDRDTTCETVIETVQLGDVIAYTHSAAGINDDFIVYGIQRQISVINNQHVLTLKTRKWIKPPSV